MGICFGKGDYNQLCQRVFMPEAPIDADVNEEADSSASVHFSRQSGVGPGQVSLCGSTKRLVAAIPNLGSCTTE